MHNSPSCAPTGALGPIAIVLTLTSIKGAAATPAAQQAKLPAAGRVKAEEAQAAAATAPSTSGPPAGIKASSYSGPDGGIKQEVNAAGLQGPGQPAAATAAATHGHTHQQACASASGAIMPNGCAVPSNVVMLAGFSSTGDATRDAAVGGRLAVLCSCRHTVMMKSLVI
eukprot:1153980-Pelagomonas_calceolata.AAC.2